MIGYITPKKAPRRRNKIQRKLIFLEPLESRLLLSTAVVWTGDGDGTSWSDAGNWQITGAGLPAIAPGAVGFTDVDVTISQNATIEMDMSPNIHNLTVHGDADAKLEFSSGQYSLTVAK